MNSGLVLNNSGTIVEAGTSGTNDWEFVGGSVLNNLSGGIVDMTTSETLFNSGSGNAINNEAGHCSRILATTRSRPAPCRSTIKAAPWPPRLAR